MENIKWLVLLGLLIVSTLGTKEDIVKIGMEETEETLDAKIRRKMTEILGHAKIYAEEILDKNTELRRQEPKHYGELVEIKIIEYFIVEAIPRLKFTLPVYNENERYRTIFFENGADTGLHFNDLGKIIKIDEGSEAEKNLVGKNWIIKSVNGEPWFYRFYHPIIKNIENFKINPALGEFENAENAKAAKQNDISLRIKFDRNFTKEDAINKYSLKLLLSYLIKWRENNGGPPSPRLDLICEGFLRLNVENREEDLMDALLEVNFLARYLGLWPGFGIRENTIVSVLRVFAKYPFRFRKLILQQNLERRTLLNVAVRFYKFNYVVKMILANFPETSEEEILIKCRYILMEDVDRVTAVSVIVDRIDRIEDIKLDTNEKTDSIYDEMFSSQKMLLKCLKPLSMNELFESLYRSYTHLSSVQNVIVLLSTRVRTLPLANHSEMLTLAGKDGDLLPLFFYFVKDKKILYKFFNGQSTIGNIINDCIPRSEVQDIISRNATDPVLILWTLMTELQNSEQARYFNMNWRSYYNSEFEYFEDTQSFEIIMLSFTFHERDRAYAIYFQKHILKLVCTFLFNNVYIMKKLALFKN